MTINLTSVTNNQTFGTCLSRTNDLVTALSANIVTVDATVGGSISTGNGFVNGMLGSNTLYATYISGGNIATNTVLTITSNVAITSNSILSVGNSSMNIISGFLSSNSSLLEGYGNQNNYVQFALTNSNTGTNASVDIAIYDSSGLAGYNFIDMGILGSGFSNSNWTIGGASDGYLYTGNTNLAIGTAGQKFINFFANGTLSTNEVMRITSGANVGIGNTNPNARLQVTGSANVSGSVNFGSTANIVGNTFIGGSANIAGDLRVSGNIVFNGIATGDILPPANSGYNLGNTTAAWSLYSNTITISNTTVTVSNTYSYGSSANAVIDQFAAATYRSAEYLIQASNSTAYQVSKVLVVHDGTTAYVTEYAIVNSAAQMLTLGVTKDVSNVQLWSIPIDATVVVKFTRTNLVV